MMTDYRGERVLVTGAGGFIGSHLVERLIQEGARVRAFVRYNSLNDWHLLRELPPDLLAQVEVVEGDIRDADFVLSACDGCSTIYNLAATISIPHSYQSPFEFLQTNLIGTAHMLFASRQCRCRRIICTSTSEVYGTAITTPMSESHPLSPQSPYAASKAGADMLALSYISSFDAPVVIVRPFNAYGPRQSARAVIPTILAQIIAHNKVRIGEISTKRDFTFVMDTVDGFIAAGQSDGAIGEIINLGSGSTISIGDVITVAGKVMNKTPEVIIEDARLRPEKSEVRLLQADSRKAASLLNWHPTVPFEDGLRLTAEYIASRIHRYRPLEYLR